MWAERLVEEIYPTLTVFHQTEFSSLSLTEMQTLFELVEKAGRSVAHSSPKRGEEN